MNWPCLGTIQRGAPSPQPAASGGPCACQGLAWSRSNRHRPEEPAGDLAGKRRASTAAGIGGRQHGERVWPVDHVQPLGWQRVVVLQARARTLPEQCPAVGTPDSGCAGLAGLQQICSRAARCRSSACCSVRCCACSLQSGPGRHCTVQQQTEPVAAPACAAAPPAARPPAEPGAPAPHACSAAQPGLERPANQGRACGPPDSAAASLSAVSCLACGWQGCM